MFDALNLFALIIFLVNFAGYHGIYLLLVKKYPHKTLKSYINEFREEGLRYVIENRQHMVLVQALRDAIMVCNVFASSTLIFVGALMNLLINIQELAKSLEITNIALFKFKIVFMIGILSISFIFLISALRYYRLVSILILTPPEVISKRMKIPAHKYLGKLLNSGCGYYTLGSRGLLYSLLILLWLANTWVFITLVTIVTVLFAKYRDFHTSQH